METLLTNDYTHLDKKYKPFKANSRATGTKELLQTKMHTRKCHVFTKWNFEKFINRMKEGYKMIQKLSYEN